MATLKQLTEEDVKKLLEPINEKLKEYECFEYDNEKDPNKVFSSKKEIKCPFCDNNIAADKKRENVIFFKRTKSQYIHMNCLLEKLFVEIMDDNFWKSCLTQEGKNHEEDKC